jgi:hypothetical protein
MVKYTQSGNRFIIDDFQHAKTFASFLPAVAGTDGKPLWAFYANVGQCMGGFGVTSRDTPITPFDSANLAYQNIKIKSFRTFLKINDVYVTPFFTSAPVEQQMSIGMADFHQRRRRRLSDGDRTYSSVSHKQLSRSHPQSHLHQYLARKKRPSPDVDGSLSSSRSA